MKVCSETTREGTIWPVDAALRPEGKAGPLVADPGQPPGLLRALGQDLGVPGAAQGPPGRRRPRARPAVRRRWSPRWCGRSPSARGSSPTCRPCADGCSTTSRPRTPSDSSSWAPVGCATSSSPSSCSSSCTAARTPRCGCPTTLSALAELTRGGYVGREDGETLHQAYSLPAHARAPDPALPAPADPGRAHRREPTCAGSDGHWGSPKEPLGAAGEDLALPPARGPPAAREALLPPAARGGRPDPRLGRPPHHGPGAGAAGRPGLRRPAGGAAPPGGADQRGLPVLLDPADAAAGDAPVVRRLARPGRGPLRLPPDQRVAGGQPLVPAVTCATRGRSPSGWPGVLSTSAYATDLLEREPQGVRMLGRRPAAPDRGDR